jgi:hypothetical protein
MSNYHFEVSTVSRNARHGKKSVTRLASYISGRKLYDGYGNKWYSHERSDVALCKIYLPPDSPSDFRDLQTLCDRIEAAEARTDSRTAREIKASLPNELPYYELLTIVEEFIEPNFIKLGLPAVVAIHKGINIDVPDRNNPHVHIIIPTRTVGPEGFSKKKFLPLNDRANINLWRSRWAEEQNRAYERCELDVRVSHLSLKAQEIEREPAKYVSRLEYARNRSTITAEREKVKEAHAQEQSRSGPEIQHER